MPKQIEIAEEEIQVVSYSEIDTLRQCGLKHQIAYKERWVSPTLSPALEKGTLWHNVMESHYRAIKWAQDSRIAGTKVSDDELKTRIWATVGPWLSHPKTGAQTEFQELIEWMYVGYLDHYGFDLGWRILAVEHAPVLPLLDAEGNQTRFHLKLKIDLVVQEVATGHLWIVDHKSCKDLPNDKMLEIADQFGLYTWALRQLGRNVFGSVHSAARTQRNKTPGQTLESRFKRSPMYRTDHELDVIAYEAYEMARRAYEDVPPGQAVRSPNEDLCRWRCDFTEPCLLARKGLPLHRTLQDFGFSIDTTRH